MANKESVLNLRLTAQNEANGAFTDVEASLDSLAKAAAEAAKSVSESFTSIASSANQSMTDTSWYVSEGDKAIRDMVTTFGESSTQIDESIRGISEAMNAMASGTEQDSQAASKSVDSISQAMAGAAKSVDTQTKDVVKAMDDMAKGTQGAVDGVKKSVDSLGGLVALQQLGQSLEDIGSKGEHLFDFAVEQGADFQQSMQNINTVLAANTVSTQSWNDKMQDSAGLTQQLQELALSLGSRGAQSANQIAEAMDTMLRAGVDGKAVLDGAAESAQNVSIVTGDQIDEAANLVTEIFHMYREQFQENGQSMTQNMQQVGDVLTGTLLSARINSQDFISTLKYVGPIASEVGASLTDTATATALLAQYGIKGLIRRPFVERSTSKNSVNSGKLQTVQGRWTIPSQAA